MTDAAALAAFIDKAYQEAGDLLVEVRDYVAGQSPAADQAPSPADRLRLTQALSRVTRRLTEAMAWLLVQKAVAAGEITAAEAAETDAAVLPADGLGEVDPTQDTGNLPLAARGLIDRSRRLYAEVAQLDSGRRRLRRRPSVPVPRPEV